MVSKFEHMEYYKIYFCNNNRKTTLRKYICCLLNQLSRDKTELVLTVLANLNERHVQFSLQLRGDISTNTVLFLTKFHYTGRKINKFPDALGLSLAHSQGLIIIKTNEISKIISSFAFKKFDVCHLQCCLGEALDRRVFMLRL